MAKQKPRKSELFDLSKQDPCVWDVFAATIHEARTGIKQPWREWTPIRKKYQLEGKL